MDHTTTWELHHEAPDARLRPRPLPAIVVELGGASQTFVGSTEALERLATTAYRAGAIVQYSTVQLVRG